MTLTIKNIYKKLLKHYGTQKWWPAKTKFEIMVGTILTQNTSWTNVEYAIKNLRDAKILTAKKILNTPDEKLAALIRPAGYYNVKTKRLKALCEYLTTHKPENLSLENLRPELLNIHGVGNETADCIALYVYEHPIFVVDAYTARLFSRHNFISANADYETIQALFHKTLPRNVSMYNEYHALIVECCKDFCKAKNPKCDECPLSR